MTAIKPDWTMEIEISSHASERSHAWFGWIDPDEIRGEIRSALLEDRFAPQRPNWTRSGNGDAGESRPGFYYAWNPKATRCWVLAVFSRRQIRVATVLLERESERRLTDDRLLRPGMARRP